MSAKHTEGPWSVHEMAGRTLCVIDAQGMLVVRKNGMGSETSARGRANARLIAAAPELLAALEAVRSALPWSDDHNPFPDDPRWGKAMKAADEAIAKATGEA